MISIDESRKKFEQYVNSIDKYIKEDLSESDTRSKLIDYLLIEVLGWGEEDIRREGHSSAGYYDYEISITGLHFIVEAKKQFDKFVLPANHRKSSIKSLYQDNKVIIDQVRGYSVEFGIPYGVITNGTQFVLLKLLNTNGKNWKDNQCLLFNGPKDIEDRYLQFYENLSKFGVINNGGFKYDIPLNVFESSTIISTLIDREKELIRNSLSSKIAPIIDRVFGEIFSDEDEDDLDFIEKCFVKNEETIKNKTEIGKLFADKAPEIANIIPANNTESIKRQISAEINSDEVTIKNAIPPKPIIIIGTKGAGKTSFINHLFKYNLTDDDIENHLTIYLDLRKFFNNETFFEPTKITAEILDSIYNKYEELELYSLKTLIRIYYREVKRNDEGIWLYDKSSNETSYQTKLSDFLTRKQQDSVKHFEHLSKYLLRERRKRIIVIIDNADQFDNDIQEQVFLFAHSLAKSSLCGSVISLREGYYYKWRFSPPFDAYESNVYHITAPSYSDVLQKRIDFTLEKVSLTGNTRGENNSYTIDLPNQSIIEFLSGLKSSLFSNKNTDLIDYLNYSTYPNIREGLRVFKQFLTSGHTNVSDYILRERFRMENRENPQVIPMHEFIKSIGLQNKHYYNSEISLIHNLLIPPADSDDHFIKLYFLAELCNLLEKKGGIGKYCSNSEIVEKFNSFGYRINIINMAIQELLKVGLIDTDDQMTDIDWKSLPSNFNMCITSKGHYYFKTLLGRFHYLDLIVQDTPVFDKRSFESIRSLFPLSDNNGKRNLQSRIATVKKFIEYLKEREAKQSAQLKSVYGSMVDYIENMVSTDFERINRSILSPKP